MFQNRRIRRAPRQIIRRAPVLPLPKAPPATTLEGVYQLHCRQPSDINEHLPVLLQRVKEIPGCQVIVEIGVRNMVSTWALLWGLVQSTAQTKQYYAIDLEYPKDRTKLDAAQRFAQQANIQFQFAAQDDLHMQPIPCDLLFIDTLHTYPQLTAELEKLHSSARRYIVLHDTSPPWGYQDEVTVTEADHARYSAYPMIDYRKKGLWAAVEDFLKRHSDEWRLKERRLNNSGLTTLMRIKH